MNIIGWCTEQNKFGDDTNVCHLIVEADNGHDPDHCACGYKSNISKRIQKEIPSNINPCRHCRRIAKKHGIPYKRKS